MVFNDTTNEQGIVQEIDSICNSDSNSYPIKAKTRRVNNALDRFFTLAVKADGRWELDGTDHTDYPISVTDIENGKIDYTFPPELLEIFRVEIKDENGNWREIYPIDQQDYKGQASDEFMKEPSQPMYYDKKYGSIWLYPSANYDQDDSLKIHYNRKFKRMASTDLAVVPGIPEIFHPYLARYASLPFLVEKAKANKNDIAEMIRADEDEITKYYSRRARDSKSQALPRRYGRPNFI
jgi:hypothetical protein